MPSVTWLKKNKLGALYACICKYPEMFDHIEQESKIFYKSEQEHIKFIKDNNIRSCRSWTKYWKDNNLQEQSYFSSPWETFNKSAKDFFEDIFGEKKTKEEHISLIKEKSITSSTQWTRYYKSNNLQKQGYLHSPWSSFSKTCKDFFDDVCVKKTKEEHISLMNEKGITSSVKWRDYYKKNNLREQRYLLDPWSSSGKTIKRFFEDIFGKKDKKTKEEHIALIKEKSITSSTQWTKYWKDNNLQKQGYRSKLWGFSNKTCKRFFEDIFGKKIWKTEDEHISLIKEKGLTSSTQWIRCYKSNNLQKQGYLSDPWKFFNKTIKQFFEDIFGKKIWKTEDEHISLIKEKGLTSSTQWIRCYKSNNLQKQNYLSIPWASFGKTVEQFLEEDRM